MSVRVESSSGTWIVTKSDSPSSVSLSSGVTSRRLEIDHHRHRRLADITSSWSTAEPRCGAPTPPLHLASPAVKILAHPVNG
jgi:hypothetical protein